MEWDGTEYIFEQLNIILMQSYYSLLCFDHYCKDFGGNAGDMMPLATVLGVLTRNRNNLHDRPRNTEQTAFCPWSAAHWGQDWLRLTRLTRGPVCPLWAESFGVAPCGENGENGRRSVVFACPGKLGNDCVSPGFPRMPGFFLNKVYAPGNGVFLFALTGNTFSWSRLSRH